MNYIWLVIIYIGGFVFSLLFFKLFGKKLGFDYSGEKTYANYDDYDSNAEAYASFSVGWFVILPIMMIFGLCKLIFLLIKKMIKD